MLRYLYSLRRYSRCALLQSLLWTPAQYVFYGAVSMAAGGLCLLLPETAGRHLPETIQECEQFKR